MSNFYIFYVDVHGDNCYERTCGTKERAEERVRELKQFHPNALYFENKIPKNFKYFY